MNTQITALSWNMRLKGQVSKGLEFLAGERWRDRLTPGFEAFGRERQGGRVKERKHDLSLN